jgi:hypothetical protein
LLVGGDARLFMGTWDLFIYSFFYKDTPKQFDLHLFTAELTRLPASENDSSRPREKSEMIGCLGAVKEHFDVYGVVTTLAQLV